MKREYYETPKASKMMRFFWKAAGGDKYLLNHATYADQIKYMCLGGIVMATGVMAGLAGGYAFYTIFSPKTSDVLDKTKTVLQNPDYIPTDIPTVILSILFGTLWGLVIFNIDRFIVTSTGKGDGTEAITWEEFKSAIPRIVMGIIIAVSISKPVEIRMFKTEIDLEIKKQQDKEKEIGIMQATQNYEKKVAETKAKIGKIQNEIDAKNEQIASKREEITKEITGKNKNGAGYGTRATNLQNEVSTLIAEINSLKNTAEYISAVDDMNKYGAERKSALADVEKRAATLDGLLIRIQKAHELSPTISLFITLLFLAIELTPIFFKLMLIKTPYDYMEENVKELIKAENGIEVRYDYYKDKQGQERHLVIHHAVDKMIYEKIKATEAQKTLIDYAVNKHIEEQKARIDANPEAYIKTEENGTPA